MVPLFSIYYSFLNIRPPKLVTKRLSDTPILRIYIYMVVGKLSDAPLVHLSCPSRAPLVPLSCPSRAPLVHLSCPSRAPLVHLWRQCPRVPTVSQPCQNEKYRVPFSVILRINYYYISKLITFLNLRSAREGHERGTRGAGEVHLWALKGTRYFSF